MNWKQAYTPHFGKKLDLFSSFLAFVIFYFLFVLNVRYEQMITINLLCLHWHSSIDKGVYTLTIITHQSVNMLHEFCMRCRSDMNSACTVTLHALSNCYIYCAQWSKARNKWPKQFFIVLFYLINFKRTQNRMGCFFLAILKVSGWRLVLFNNNKLNTKSKWVNSKWSRFHPLEKSIFYRTRMWTVFPSDTPHKSTLSYYLFLFYPIIIHMHRVCHYLCAFSNWISDLENYIGIPSRMKLCVGKCEETIECYWEDKTGLRATC